MKNFFDTLINNHINVGEEDDKHLKDNNNLNLKKYSNSQRVEYWKKMLWYLNADTEKNKIKLHKLREDYLEYIDKFIFSSFFIDNPDDDPLSISKTSHYNEFFVDKLLQNFICRDTFRLRGNYPFFHSKTDYPLNIIAKKTCYFFKYSELCKQNNIKIDSYENCFNNYHYTVEEISLSIYNRFDIELHHEVISRILFIYLKLNKNIKYIQGMHEILGVLYYIFYNDKNELNRSYAEMDTFYCFTNLMSELEEYFIVEYDFDKNAGVGKLINSFMNILMKIDRQCYTSIVRHNIIANSFAYTWLVFLFSFNFDIDDVASIWDIAFSDKNRFEFLKYVAVSMIIHIKNEIIGRDHDTVLMLLKKYPINRYSIDSILKLARQLYKDN